MTKEDLKKAVQHFIDNGEDCHCLRDDLADNIDYFSDYIFSLLQKNKTE